MLRFPMQFRVMTEAEPGIGRPWRAQALKVDHTVDIAIAPEFQGPGGSHAPQELYAMALLNDYVANFKLLAEHNHLEFAKLEADVLLTVDRNERGTPWMSDGLFTVRIAGCADKISAEKIHERAVKACTIINSTRTRCTFHFFCSAKVPKSQSRGADPSRAPRALRRTAH
jgi:organic hydroperoxide reductase OsmC/OhrA